MTKRMPSPRPSLVISAAKWSGLGSMCGSPPSWSAIASMSKKTAPGMWASGNSLAPNRPVLGRCQEASMTPTSAPPSSAASSAVVHKLREVMGEAKSLRRENDPDPAIDPSLLLDLGDGRPPDLTGARDVGSAAGLKVQVFDSHEADPAAAARRLDRHGFHERGIGVKRLVGDPALADRRVEGDQFIELAFDLALVERRLAVEVEAAFRVADRTAGYRIGHGDGEQMQRRMGAHPLVAPVPVDPGDNGGAGSGKGDAFRGNVQDGLAVGVVDRVDDRDGRTTSHNEVALIARLPAALGVEHRAVERHAALIREQDRRRGLAPVGVVAEQGLGHGTNTSGARPFASSQRGTGRFFSRRKAGLNSFEA